MSSPRRWSSVGLLLLATTSLTIASIVSNCRAHTVEDSQITDCNLLNKDSPVSQVPSFFALMLLSKVVLGLLQLATAIDCLITADARLKGSDATECSCVAVGLAFYDVTSFPAAILAIGTWTSVECCSCCLAHKRLRGYSLWCVPSLLLMALTALALLPVLVCNLYLGIKSFMKLLYRSFTYEATSTSKDA